MTLDYEHKIDRLKESLEESDEFGERNVELLLDFERDLRLKDYSSARIYKLLSTLRVIARHIGFAFDEATEDDLKDLIAWTNSRDVSEATKEDYRIVTKRFYKWLNGGEHPEIVDWISTSSSHSKDVLPENLLEEEDVERLLGSCLNPRDRALVAVLWETGARIGELIDLAIGDLKSHENGMKAIIDGKTGPRRILLISSVPHLRSWLRSHPREGESGAPLWVNIRAKHAGEKMEYRNILKTLKDIAERAGVDKPVNPHHFRHSRATYLASKFTEAQLCEWFGWVQGSDQPAKYVHLSGRDIDSDYALLHGIEDDGEPEESKFSPRECPRCEELNEPDAKFCQRCGQALEEGAALESLDKKTLGEWVSEKAEEVEATGSLDDLLLAAAKKGLRELMENEDIEKLARENRRG